jgi:hypothetical protein
LEHLYAFLLNDGNRRGLKSDMSNMDSLFALKKGSSFLKKQHIALRQGKGWWKRAWRKVDDSLRRERELCGETIAPTTTMRYVKQADYSAPPPLRNPPPRSLCFDKRRFLQVSRSVKRTHLMRMERLLVWWANMIGSEHVIVLDFQSVSTECIIGRNKLNRVRIETPPKIAESQLAQSKSMDRVCQIRGEWSVCRGLNHCYHWPHLMIPM